jgi:hypothetical protein
MERNMTSGTAPQFEIPAEMREMTQKSMEQVRVAMNNYFQALERIIPANVMGGSELSNKILGYAERNLASAFEFAGRLAQVRDVQSFARLQVDFIQAQTQAVAEQTKDISDAMTRAIMNSFEPMPKGTLSS